MEAYNGKCEESICWEKISLCGTCQRVKRRGGPLSWYYGIAGCTCIDPLWCGESEWCYLPSGIRYCIFRAPGWRIFRRDICGWYWCTCVFCRIFTGTVWSESRFGRAVCETFERERRSGDPFCYNICIRGKIYRRRSCQIKRILYQSGGFPRDERREAGDFGTAVWRSGRCCNLWRFPKYVWGGSSYIVWILKSGNDIPGFQTYSELFCRRGKAWSFGNRNSCTRHLLVGSLPSYDIFNRVEKCYFWRWLLSWADWEKLWGISGSAQGDLCRSSG